MAFPYGLGNVTDSYGTFISSNQGLTIANQTPNAKYFYNYMITRGWSKNAIYAILGNMQAESSINPGRWEGNTIPPQNLTSNGWQDNRTNVGFGIVQWTRYTKYTDWLKTSQYRSYDAAHLIPQMERINHELQSGIQWSILRNTADGYVYNLSFLEFSRSNQPIRWLAESFVSNYEKPRSIIGSTAWTKSEWLSKSNASKKVRGDNAEAWASRLAGIEPPTPPVEPPHTYKRMKTIFYGRRLF